MNPIKYLLFMALGGLLMLAPAQAQKMAVPYYSAGQVKFYDLSTNPATLLGTLNTVVSGTTYKPNGVAFFGTDLFVAYDEPSSDGFLHFKGVSVSGGTVTFSSAVKVTTGTVTTEIVVDGAGTLYVGCGFGSANRVVRKFVRSGSGTYSSSTNLTVPTVTNSQWYSGIGGLTFDASGNLYATDLSDNRVLKWTAGAGTPAEFKCTSPTTCQFTNTGGTSVYLFSGPEGLVFDATGNLWVSNNNDFNQNLNASGGSLVKLSASLLSGAGGTVTASNATIYTRSAAKFGGMSKVGSNFYVNDQGNGKVWQLNTTTGALTDVGIAATYPGNGHPAEVPSGVFPAVTVNNPTVSVLPASAIITAGQSVTLTASGCAAGNTYLWNTGDATARIIKSPATTTTYIAYCKNGATQSSGLSTQITVNPAPATGITATGTLPVTSSLQTGNPRARTFTYHAPSTTPACNLPLLIVLHGDGGTGAGIMNYTNFNALGDAQGFITVYPDAGTVAGSVQWNKFADNAAGSGDNGNDANAPDDVQFISDLIDHLHKKFGINRRKVYVSGHSGGGYMAYALALADQTKSKIAGIAPVAASLWGNNTYLSTQFGASVFVKKPVLHIHSTTDNVVTFPDVASSWVWPESSFGSATCGISSPTATIITPGVPTYTFCNSPIPVVLVGLNRAGLLHNWPTTANSGYNTEAEIWNFMNPYSSAATLAIAPSVSPLSATIALGGNVGLTATGCGSLTYKWSNNQTGSSITVSPLATTTYTVGCYSDNNCLSQNSSNSSRVTVNTVTTLTPPTISASSLFVCSTGSAVLSAMGCSGGVVRWNTGQTGSTITILGSSGSSRYTATCLSGGLTSTNSNTLNISVMSPPAPPTLISSPSGVVAPGTSVMLTATNYDPTGMSVAWSSGIGNNPTINVSPTQSTTYTAIYTLYYYPACSSAPAMIAVTVSTGPTAPVVDDHIKTDQFGYLPSAQKIAVISNPDPAISQYNQISAFTPSTSYQLRRVTDNVSVFSAAPVAWNGGATHAQSGDKVWWFDFSSVTTPGSYYVYDVGNNKRSYGFDINTSVYETPARQALAALKMQRCGIARFGQLGIKTWSDVACHVGSLQDTQCRDVSDPTNAGKARDLSGGWHDAGDFNKYSLYASEALHNLLKAYEENPSAWTVTAGVIPAILDEAKYELDWLLKMQDTDGGVRCKVSIQGYGASSPPSNDTRQRFYGGKSTLTTLAVSSVLAHAASVFGAYSGPYATTLRTAAQNAWNWASANPNVVFDNTPFLIGGGGSYNPDNGIYGDSPTSSYYRATSYKTVAAAYLFNAFGATAGAAYKTSFESLYASTNQMTWTAGADTYFPDWQVVLDGLLTYANHASATASHATAIRNKFTALVTTSAKLLPAYTNATDAYRAYLNYYPWNSNQQKAQIGIQMQTLKASNLSPASNTALQNASLGFMNYLHGLNPNAKCYLSQMNTLGADNSQNEVYHGWFWDGTVYDNALTSGVGPFPGLLIGGPNQDYTGTVSPPSGQPAQKAYKDWNTDYPDASYEITEIGIYTQAAYIRLASRFMGGSSTCTLAVGTAVSVQSGNWTDPATWQCGTIPTATSLTQIKAGHAVTINGTAYSNRVQVETAAKVIYTPAGRLVLGQ